jgi:hypothetical protein
MNMKTSEVCKITKKSGSAHTGSSRKSGGGLTGLLLTMALPPPPLTVMSSKEFAGTLVNGAWFAFIL